jgi:FdhD protein
MPSTTHITVRKVTGSSVADASDLLATEEPLEIKLEYSDHGKRVQKSISVTMRTPGNDEELACGFLYTEGIIRQYNDITSISKPGKDDENTLLLSLADGVIVATQNLERNFYTTSSCGVCGKASIEAVRVACTIPDLPDSLRVSKDVIYKLPDLLRRRQDVFENTGGLHACALFEADGTLLLSREDVGRHNALDKLAGAALTSGMLPLSRHVLMLSGRISFELVQKAIMAGIRVIAAVGAPSSLAAEMAEEWGVTLIGFLRGERFNIYSGAERIVI